MFRSLRSPSTERVLGLDIRHVFVSFSVCFTRGSRISLWFAAEDSEQSQRRPTRSAAPSHNSRQDLSLVARRPQEHRLARLSLASLSSSNNSLRQEDLFSAALRLSSHRRGGRCLGVPSSLHSPPVDCSEAQRPNSSPLKVGLCLGAPQLNQLRVADSLAHNSPLNNREDHFLAARSNQLSNRELPSLGTPNNPLPDRRRRSLGRHSSSLPPGLRCLVVPSSRRQDPRYSEIPNPHCLMPHLPRLTLSSNHPLWERHSVRNL